MSTPASQLQSSPVDYMSISIEKTSAGINWGLKVSTSADKATASTKIDDAIDLTNEAVCKSFERIKNIGKEQIKQP